MNKYAVKHAPFIIPLIIVLVTFIVSGILMSKIAGKSYAQATSYGISNSLIIPGKVQDGDIISFSSKGYVLSSIPYDPTMVGVMSVTPAIAITVEGDNIAKTYPVVSIGNANVRVSTVNGAIKKGDLITTSSIPGVGMKSAQSGFVLGSALQDFTASNKNEVGKIMISLNIYYFYTKPFSMNTGLRDLLSLSAVATYEQPSVFLKYLIAGFVLLLSILFGFMSFGRSASAGIEALGRNPLAGKSIQFGIFVNALVTVIIILAGIITAYFVIKL